MLDRFTGGNKEARNGLTNSLPVGRLAQADEIAQAIVYLASDKAGFLTGAVLAADGGYTAQ